MNHRHTLLRAGSIIPMVLGAGLSAGGVALLAEVTFAAARSNGAVNPPAVAKPGGGRIQIAQCGAKKACNPCAAKKACNPCAARKACNPCAAKGACGACNPCNPCGGGAAAYSAKCEVPRLVKAALCNPCAAKKACNPCAAKACNPCAAKKACNPCAAKKACNPCAAKAACGACNPCGATAAPKLNTAEARAAYDCLKEEMVAGYAKSGANVATTYVGWATYNTEPYVSDTHGGRFVNNYANAAAKNYGKFEEVGKLPEGALLAKDSFVVHQNGKMAAGPLFLMQKMSAGFYEASGDWRYTMVMPDGTVFGTTKGEGHEKMQFCIECHAVVAEAQDSLMFLPDEYRAKRN